MDRKGKCWILERIINKPAKGIDMSCNSYNKSIPSMLTVSLFNFEISKYNIIFR